jgi:hypothetical protein
MGLNVYHPYIEGVLESEYSGASYKAKQDPEELQER